MVARFIRLDCRLVIPECGYTCAKCIQEIRGVLGKKSGVLEVSLGARGELSGIVVKYDPERTNDDQLLEEFRALPSFYRGRFVPEVLNGGENGIA